MPALRLFGRRWLLAEDDVPVVAFFGAFFHFAFLPPIVIWFVLMYTDGICSHKRRDSITYGGLLVTYTASFVLETAMVVVGMKGAPFETAKRKPLPVLIYLDLLSMVVQVAFISYLTYLGVLYFSDPCDAGGPAWDDTAFLWSVVACFWLYFLVYIIMLAVVYIPCHDYRSSKTWSTRYSSTLYMGMLMFAWNPFNKESRTFHRQRAERMGENMRSLFGHLDLTLTDLILGFANARHEAKTSSSLTVLTGKSSASTAVSGGGEEQDLTLDMLEQQRYTKTIISGEAEVEHDALVEASHYFQHALAAYGWMIYLLDSGIVMGMPGVLCGGRASMFPCMTGKSNLEVACRILDVQKRDILFLREQGSKPNVLSYVMSVDRETKSVVIAIRGAVTLNDNVRDVLFEPGELDAWVQGPKDWTCRPPPHVDAGPNTVYYAHGDYLGAARSTLLDIMDCAELEKVLADPDLAGYGLVVTGHSLGAACAYFVALYLRKLVPDLTCWCFSPPLGLADKKIALDSNAWCTTVVCGKEFPPRFSAATVDRSRDQIVYSLASIQEPKLKRLYKLLWKFKSLKHDAEKLKLENFNESSKAVLLEYINSVNNDNYRKSIVRAARRMSVPGKVIYLRPREAETDELTLNILPTDREYTALWVANAAFEEQGLLLSGRFLSDHMPDYAATVLRGLSAPKEDDQDIGDQESS